MSRFYADDAVVGEMTKNFVASGHRILQPFMFDEDEGRHADILLSILNPKVGARVLDLACGIGEVPRLMKAERPDVDFTLQNLSAAQLSMCPPFEKLHGDALDAAGRFDCVMLMAAIGHFDLERMMEKVSSLLDAGGKFMVYDIFADGDVSALKEIDYHAHTLKDVMQAAQRRCMGVAMVMEAPRITGVNVPDFERYFANVTPACIVFIKETVQ